MRRWAVTIGDIPIAHYQFEESAIYHARELNRFSRGLTYQVKEEN